MYFSSLSELAESGFDSRLLLTPGLCQYGGGWDIIFPVSALGVHQ